MSSSIIVVIVLLILYGLLTWNTKNNNKKLYKRKGRSFKENYKAKKKDNLGDTKSESE